MNPIQTSTLNPVTCTNKLLAVAPRFKRHKTCCLYVVFTHLVVSTDERRNNRQRSVWLFRVSRKVQLQSLTNQIHNLQNLALARRNSITPAIKLASGLPALLVIVTASLSVSCSTSLYCSLCHHCHTEGKVGVEMRMLARRE